MKHISIGGYFKLTYTFKPASYTIDFVIFHGDIQNPSMSRCLPGQITSRNTTILCGAAYPYLCTMFY